MDSAGMLANILEALADLGDRVAMVEYELQQLKLLEESTDRPTDPS